MDRFKEITYGEEYWKYLRSIINYIDYNKILHCPRIDKVFASGKRSKTFMTYEDYLAYCKDTDLLVIAFDKVDTTYTDDYKTINDEINRLMALIKDNEHFKNLKFIIRCKNGLYFSFHDTDDESYRRETIDYIIRNNIGCQGV